MSRHAITLSASLLALLAGTALAGPLNPPAGAVAPTGKPLTDVEPRIAVNATNTPGDPNSVFKITVSGSYYLTGNVTGASGKFGIWVTAPNVSIDLNGYTLLGVANSQSGIYAGFASGGKIDIKNGAVRGFGDAGIETFNAATSIDHVFAMDNVGNGVECSGFARVTNCTASGNGSRGFELGQNSVISDCVALSNAAAASDAGIYLGSGCSASRCTSSFNSPGMGFIVGPSTIVSDCTATSNVDGFQSYAGAMFLHCVATANSADGFHPADSSTIRSCQAVNNGDDGIEVPSRCTVIDNSCDSNGELVEGAGVFLLGGSNRIENNSLTFNRYGILGNGLNVTDNFIVKNTARGNVTANFSVVSSANELAPVIVNPGLNAFSTMTPWSNVSY